MILLGSIIDVYSLVWPACFRIYVIANYNLMHGQQPCEVQTSSSVIYYTTLGPPKPPKVKVVSVDLYQVCYTLNVSFQSYVYFPKKLNIKNKFQFILA